MNEALVERIMWYEKQTIAYTRKPNHAMLTNDGYCIVEKCLLKGQNRKIGLSVERLICYDRKYVVAYIRNNLILSTYLSEEEMIHLIKEIYENLHKEIDLIGF